MNLSLQDQTRLQSLIRSTQNRGITGPRLQAKIADWTKKLANQQWIPGTPWNIPDSQKKVIGQMFSDLSQGR